MKIYSFLIGLFLLITFSNCKKSNDLEGGSCNLPSSAVPGDLVGNWASGYNSSTDIVDAYNGQYRGNAFQSGKYFHFENDGKQAEFYYMANGGTYSSTATRAVGTVEFLDDNSFIFHACKAHYKGWQNGKLTVDRDATSAEVSSAGLTQRYYYSMIPSSGITWLEIKFDPNDYSGTSFRKVP